MTAVGGSSGESLGCATKNGVSADESLCKSERVVREALKNLGGSIGALLPAEVREVRLRALERLETLSPPLPIDELWRQTPPDLFSFENLTKVDCSSCPVVDVGISLLPRRASADSVVAGERLAKEALGTGISWNPSFHGEATPLAELLGAKGAELHTDFVAQLQLAFLGGGGALRVAAGTKVAEPLYLSQVIGAVTPGAAPLVVVIVERGASVVVVEDLALPRFEGIFAPRIECLLGPNAQCEFVSVQRMEARSQYLARHRFHLLRDAHLRAVHLAIGAEVSRLDLDCKLYEPGANADLFSLYLADKERHVDFHTTQSHLAPDCRSNLYCKGSAKDSSRAVYFGFIRVAEDAQRTDAYQKNRNLLLSDDARIDAIPNLEIRANDVKCSHGASVGQVGVEELFYLMSRGLPRADAERLLVEAFFEDLIGNITSEFVRDYVRSALAEKLGSFESFATLGVVPASSTVL
jgi:Fe-S cluster assembly protein SufD